MDAHDTLERFRVAYLQGNSRLADRYLTDARTALSSTARPELAVRVDVIRCALGTSSLDFDACAAARELTQWMDSEDRAYFEFLTGDWQRLESRLLPEQYRPLVPFRDDISAHRLLTGIADPLSRLIAAGVLFKHGHLSPGGVALAVETASAQGFRRPLLAWLTVQEELASTASDPDLHRKVQARIDLLKGTSAPKP
jgi:hypothetical protein